MTDGRPMTLGELRSLMRDLPDDTRELMAEAEKRYDHYDLPNRLPIPSWSDREVIEGLLGALRVAQAETARAIEERDEAIAHDRQPYPTAWAHEQALKALDKKQRELDALRALRASESEEIRG